MADSTHTINRPRKFPPGCGPSALNTGASFRPQNLVRQLPKTPNLPLRAHNRVQQRPETPKLHVLGSGNGAHKQVQQPSETANSSVDRNGSRDRVHKRRVQHPSATAKLVHKRVHQRPETPKLQVLGSVNRAHKQVQQPSETANSSLGRNGSRDGVYKRVQQPAETAKKRVPQPSQIAVRISNRDRVLEILNRFRERCEEIHRSNPKEPRPDLKAWALPEFKNIGTGGAKSIGSIPGVEVGQLFKKRAELIIAGVHGRLIRGIDYTESFEGKSVATCVVAKEGYYDKMNDPDFLLYSGEGGEIRSNGGQKDRKKILKTDQVMKRGNLALKNSIEVQNEVRVVRGVKYPHNSSGGRVLYVYDGVYQVMKYRTMKGLEGNKLFQFEMRRKPGQQPIDWKRVHFNE